MRRITLTTLTLGAALVALVALGALLVHWERQRVQTDHLELVCRANLHNRAVLYEMLEDGPLSCRDQQRDRPSAGSNLISIRISMGREEEEITKQE